MIILRYLKPLSPSSRIVLHFGRLKKRCSTGLPREFRMLSGVFLLPSTWSLFRFTWLNSVLLFVFFRPCKEFSPSRLLLSHLGLLSIEGLMVKQYCYSVCAFLKGFCQTYLLFFVNTIIIFYKLNFMNCNINLQRRRKLRTRSLSYREQI